MQTRRELLKTIVAAVGGGPLLAACGGRVGIDPSPAGVGRFFSERELALVTRLSDLIIPRTETPGAVDAEVPGFLDALMLDWASNGTRGDMRATIARTANSLRRELGKDFLAAADAEAAAALEAVDARAFAGSGPTGYRNLKGLIAQSYYASEPGATLELGWTPVPGRWEPCVERS